MQSTISVILPNYNGVVLLKNNLPSLIISLQNSKSLFEIIVVDDCSTDDSVKMLNKEFPNIKVIENETNQGFSYSCNQGIFKAKYSILCIVNTDVTFSTDYFLNGIKHFQNQNLFAVKGNIINYKTNFNDVVNIEKISLLYFKRGFLKFNQKIEYIPNSFTGNVGGQFILLGCCFLCDRNKMLELKGYDEVFSPFYWEDADLGLRALRKGYDLVYEPLCIVFHQTSSTISNYKSNRARRLVSMRNKFIFSWRHLKGFRQWFIHIFYTLFNISIRWIILDWKYYVSFSNAISRILSTK
jgi:GT2 family glycosyltransferase